MIKHYWRKVLYYDEIQIPSPFSAGEFTSKYRISFIQTPYHVFSVTKNSANLRENSPLIMYGEMETDEFESDLSHLKDIGNSWTDFF